MPMNTDLHASVKAEHVHGHARKIDAQQNQRKAWTER